MYNAHKTPDIEVDEKHQLEKEKAYQTIGLKSERLLFDSKNAAAFLSPQLPPEVYEQFKKNIFLALQKMNTSRKTKAVHKIVDSNMVTCDVFIDKIQDRISYIVSSENVLLRVQLNAAMFADFLQGIGIAKLVARINELNELIEKEKQLINEYQKYNIDKLTAELNKQYELFLSAFDYMKIVDGIYFAFISYLTRRIILTNAKEKAKVFETLSAVFSSIFQYIYRKNTKSIPDDTMKKQLNMLAAYFVLNYYLGLTSMEIFAKFKRIYGEGEVERIKKSTKLNLKNFEDFADLLYDTGVLKIQKSFFNTIMRQMFGERGYELIKGNLQDAVSYFCSINHKNILFNSISPNEKLTFRLEEIVLNEKSKVIIRKQNLMI